MLKIFIKLFVSILSILALLEITARLKYFGLDGFNYTKLNSFHRIIQSGLIMRSSNPIISYELKPNLDTNFKLKRFTTNTNGLRDKEYTLTKPHDSFRVAVVGASYVMGSAIDLEDTYHSILEDRLNLEKKGIKYEFINFGVDGYTNLQTLAVAKTKAILYRPDLLLFNFSPDMVVIRNQLCKILPTTYPFFHSYLFMAVQFWLKDWSREPFQVSQPLTSQTRELINHTLSELSSLQRNSGISISVIVLEHRKNTRHFSEEVSLLAEKYKLAFIDANAPFRQVPKTNFCAHPLDCHPNADANLIFADEIFDYLIKNNLVLK